MIQDDYVTPKAKETYAFKVKLTPELKKDIEDFCDSGKAKLEVLDEHYQKSMEVMQDIWDAAPVDIKFNINDFERRNNMRISRPPKPDDQENTERVYNMIAEAMENSGVEVSLCFSAIVTFFFQGLKNNKLTFDEASEMMDEMKSHWKENWNEL